MFKFKENKLDVLSFSDRQSMGIRVATDVTARIKELLQIKPEINMLFAAAPSQNDFLLALTADKTIPWEQINAFQMDEYIGLPENAPQKFGNYLKQHLFGKVSFKHVYYIPEGENTQLDKYEEYVNLLGKHPIDIVCLGIGENGHIAFNDPHVADFNDKQQIKIVELDFKCRQQQVHDGCFDSIEEVPTHAVTLTIPILMSAQYLFCIVPGKTKSQAIYDTLYNPVNEKCPATILRTKENVRLYIDKYSACLLKTEFENECLI